MCGGSPHRLIIDLVDSRRKGKNTVVVLVRILPHNSIYTVGSKVSYLDHICLLCGFCAVALESWKAGK